MRKNGKMALTLQKLIVQQNFQSSSPPGETKSGSLVLPPKVCLREMENLCQPLRKNGKMALTLQKLIVSKIIRAPQNLVLNGKFVSAIEKKWKNGYNSAKTRQNFQFRKSGSPVLPVSEMENLCQEKNGKMALTLQKLIVKFVSH